MFRRVVVLEFGHVQTLEASKPALEFLKRLSWDPTFDDECVIRHGESQWRLRFLHGHLEAGPRGGEESGIPFPQCIQPFLDLFEAGLPPLPLGEKIGEDLPRIALPFRNGNGREAALRQELPHRRGLRFRHEDREEPGSGERLVVRGHRIEAFDFACYLADEDLDGLVPAVVREGEAKLRERPDFIGLAVEVLEEGLGLLPRGVLLRDVEFKGQDLFA